MKVTLNQPHTTSATLQDAINHLKTDLARFERYPADSDYQRGYEAAVRDLRNEFESWV
jgi:hypothetical protein